MMMMLVYEIYMNWMIVKSNQTEDILWCVFVCNIDMLILKYDFDLSNFAVRRVVQIWWGYVSSI